MTFVFVALIVVTAQTSNPTSLPGQACTPAALVGTWKVVEAKQGAETLLSGPADPIQYKHLTPTHFMVFEVAPGGANTITWAHGGTYTVAAETYTENVHQYGFGAPFPVVRGKSFAFQCTTEGNDIWHIAGDVAGTPIVETWGRVSSEQTAPYPRRVTWEHGRRSERFDFSLRRSSAVPLIAPIIGTCGRSSATSCWPLRSVHGCRR